MRRRSARSTRNSKPSMLAVSPRRGSRPSCFKRSPAMVSTPCPSGSCAPKKWLNSSMRVTPRTVNCASADVLIILDIELIVDLADDLLDDVLDCAQPGDAAVLIDHDRHVIAVAPEFLEQHIEPLRFRHEHRRTHVLADVETLARLRGRES